MNTSKIGMSEAAVLALRSYGRPVLAAYRLGMIVFRLVEAGQIDGRRLQVREPSRRHYRQALKVLQGHGLLKPVRDLPREAAFTLVGYPEVDPAEIACTVDPFAYVSHLSAMERHGLTDRILQMLQLTTPDAKSWSVFARERMQRELGESLEAYLDAGFPRLQRTAFTRIEGRPVQIVHSLHSGAFRKTPDRELRIATIGRTFLDMLRRPDLCGGIHHVLQVYEEHAPRYLPLIADEVDQHGEPIDQVRAGYVLEERCGLQHASFERWRQQVKRGGSRKLVGQAEYASTFSERWCLSLNADL